jgi:hypothetical protein
MSIGLFDMTQTEYILLVVFGKDMTIRLGSPSLAAFSKAW